MKLKKIININENCWDGYEMVGMKMKDGKEVPNCVPKNEVKENVSVKKDRRGNDTDNLIVKLDGKEYEVAFSGDGWKDAYGISFPKEDTYRMLNKDKKAKEMWNKMKPMVDKYLKTKNEVVEASAPGQWVAFLSMARGKKLLKTFDTARGAKMFLSKNVDKLLGGANVESVGIMTKTQWDEREAKYAIEGINEATLEQGTKLRYEKNTFVVDYVVDKKYTGKDGFPKYILKVVKSNYPNKIKVGSTEEYDDSRLTGLIRNRVISFVKNESVEGINEATNKTFKIPTQRGILHIEVEEDPAGIFVDVIFNKVEVTMTDIQFPTGEVKITQKQKRVKLKEGINECGCGGNGGIKLAPMVSAVNEAEYKFGSVEYTAKNMTPTDILELAMAYHQTPITKLAGKNIDHRIRTARDLARLVGRTPINPNDKSKDPALLLFLYKSKLVNTDEYKDLYNGLLDKLKKISKYVKNADPSTRKDAAVAKMAARADMKREF